MFINGEEFLGTADEMIEAFSKLPSAFNQRTVNVPPSMEYEPGTENSKVYKEASRAHKQWRSYNQSLINQGKKPDAEDPKLQEVLGTVQQCINFSRENGETLAEAYYRTIHGNILHTAGKSEQAIAPYEDAKSIYERHQRFDKLHRVITNLHDVIATAWEQGGYKDDELAGKLRPLRKLHEEVRLKVKNQAVNPLAYRVGQGEFGFSSEQPIGAADVQDCLCLAIRNPKTCMTVVTHIDRRRGNFDLEQIIGPLRDSPSEVLEVRVFGARFAALDPPEKDSTARRISKSKENLENLWTVLREQNVNVISAWIQGGKGQPSVGTIDPKTFELEESVPGISSVNEMLSLAMLSLNKETLPLREAFHMQTLPGKFLPVLFDVEAVTALHSREKTEDEMYRWYGSDRDNQSDIDKMPLVIERRLAAWEYYERSVKYVQDHLEAHIANLKSNGITVFQRLIDKATQKIQSIPIYVGEGAVEANQPLLDFIDKHLIQIIHPPGKGPVAMFHLDRFDKVNLQDQKISGEQLLTEAANVQQYSNPIETQSRRLR